MRNWFIGNYERNKIETFIAKRSPVVLFLAKKTRPKAPRLIGLIISKSSMEVRSLEECIGLVLKLRTTSSSRAVSSSIKELSKSTFSSSTSSQSCRYFSLDSQKSSDCIDLNRECIKSCNRHLSKEIHSEENRQTLQK